MATDLVLAVTQGEVSHAALVLCTNPVPIVLEAVNPRTRTVPLDVSIQDHALVYLLKDLTLSRYQQEQVIREALKWSTRDYSFLQCVLVGIDDLTRSRWLCQSIKLPNQNMCSWLVAESRKAIGKDFGCPHDATDPQDILDFARSHPQFYQILKLRG